MTAARRRPKAPVVRTPDELEFQDALKLHLGAHPALRWWRQNSGVVPIRNHAGKVERYFHAGPPAGAADLSGIVRPEGWRLEVEMKSATGDLEPEQEVWRDFIVASGGVHAVVKYDASLSLADNLAAGTALILAAIAARRAR
jgi:hypothetical protein